MIVAKLTPKQAAAYRLSDNKLNESDWDLDLVLEELKMLDPSLQEITGFDISKLSDEATDSLGGNREVSVAALDESLGCECPKCGFKFPLPA